MKNLLTIAVVALSILTCHVVVADEPAAEKSQVANYVTAIQVAAKPEAKHGVNGYAIFEHVGDEFSRTDWMEKTAFERQFLRVSESTGEDAGKITDATVDRFIVSEVTEQAGNRGTVTVLSTAIGYDAVKTATIAETYAFDKERSAEVSKSRARAHVWELIGFVKQWSEHCMADNKPPVSDSESE